MYDVKIRRHFRNSKKEYLKATIEELENKCKAKDIRDVERHY